MCVASPSRQINEQPLSYRISRRPTRLTQQNAHDLPKQVHLPECIRTMPIVSRSSPRDCHVASASIKRVAIRQWLGIAGLLAVGQFLFTAETEIAQVRFRTVKGPQTLVPPSGMGNRTRWMPCSELVLAGTMWKYEWTQLAVIGRMVYAQ